ncbi:MAG: DUF177 domain-containing protein [Deferribacteres bacterium]|nr:DUF177 domain-containing protein [Deferribacteres bacterium]
MKLQISHLKDGLHSDHLLDSASAFGFENPEDFADKIAVTLNIDKRGSDFFIKFQVEAKMVLRCDRCLEPFETTISDHSSALYTTKEEFVSDDSSTYLIRDGDSELEIGTEVREIILLAVPIKALCSENCKGICKCGQNLNKEACLCTKKDIDPRWDALKKLKGLN